MEDDLSHPMDAPVPVLAVLGVIAILLLGSLMAIDVFWQASGPTTVAHAPPPPAHPAPPPG